MSNKQGYENSKYIHQTTIGYHAPHKWYTGSICSLSSVFGTWKGFEIMKRRLFSIAWSIVDQFDSFSAALTHAWKVIRLQLALCTQALVNFKYKKVDGSIRQAVGTLETVPTPKGGFRKVNHGLLTYFDLQQNEWRCAKVENIIFN